MSTVRRVRREISGCPGGALFKLLVALAVIFAAVALAWMLFLPAVVTAATLHPITISVDLGRVNHGAKQAVDDG